MANDPFASVDAAPDPEVDHRRAVSFDVGRRGYDQRQVDQLLGEMATEMDDLQRRVAELREREADLLAALDAAEYRADDAEGRALALRERLDATTLEPAPPAVDDRGAASPETDRSSGRADDLDDRTRAQPDHHGAIDLRSSHGTDATLADRPGDDPRDIAAIVGEETVRIVEAARHAAVEIGARARVEAEHVLAEAREEARVIRADAEIQLLHRTREADDAVAARLLEAADAVQEAQSRAQTIVDDAFTEAATVVLRAREEAAAVLEAGEERSRSVIADATAARDDLLVDLVRRRKLLRRQVEQLEAGRVRLRSAYEVVEAALGDATGELDRSVGEARDAALAAADRSDAERDPELEAAGAALGADPEVLAARLDPSGTTPDHAATSDVTTGGGAPAGTGADGTVPVEPPPVGSHNAVVPGEDLPIEDLPVDAVAGSGPGVSDAGSVGTGDLDAHRPTPAASSADDHPVTGTTEADAPAAAEPAAVAVADPAPVDPSHATAEPDAAEPPAADPADEPGVVVTAEADPAADNLDPVATDVAAMGLLAVTSGAGPADAASRKRAPDPVEFEGRWSSAVRVLPPGPETTETVVRTSAARSGRRSRIGASASEVFARLRAGDAHQPSLFEDPRTEPAAETEPGAAPGTDASIDSDPEGAWLDRRDAALAPALRALRRRVKATLADDEDSLLEALRRTSDVPVTVDALRDARARRDDLVAAMVTSLAAAAAAGRELVAGLPGVAAPVTDRDAAAADQRDASTVDVDAIAIELAAAITEPLEERLERSVARYHRAVAEAAGGDPAAASGADREAARTSLVSSIKAAYRARRGVQVQVPTEHAVLGAGHRGMVAALAPGTPLRWVVAGPAAASRRGPESRASGADVAVDVPSTRSCDSCVAVADVGAGDTFGHGHLLPPARPGCRCSVAPVSAVVPKRS